LVEPVLKDPSLSARKECVVWGGERGWAVLEAHLHAYSNNLATSRKPNKIFA